MARFEPTIPTSLNPDAYLTDVQAAALLNVTAQWLRDLRCKGGGCQFYKIGRTVRYKVSELKAWAESRAGTSTSNLRAA